MSSQGEPGSVAVLGGGVSGITTALLLQLQGLQTTLYARERPSGDPSQAWAAPEFATLHAAASVLPHSVRSSRMPEWTSTSRAFFRALAFRAEAGVRTQTHYEMFERASVPSPAYAHAVDNFEMLYAHEVSDHRVPRRGDAAAVVGWRFDAYFCEAPTYLRYLYRFYEASGGHVKSSLPSSKGRLLSYLQLGHRFLINCTGQGAAQLLERRYLGPVEDVPDPSLFEPLADPWKQKIVRGHYIRAAIRELLVDDRGRLLSYNYTPTSEVYRGREQQPADVYCYPRSDAWLLGGSRQEHVTDELGDRWLGSDADQGVESFERPDGQVVEVPRPIFVLNAEIIDRITQGSVALDRLRRNAPELFSAGVGYRFERDHPEESVRLACSRVRHGGVESVVVHNYGHGGAGFTLSWGCAVDVLDIVLHLTRAGWPRPAGVLTELPEEFRVIGIMLSDLITQHQADATEGEAGR